MSNCLADFHLIDGTVFSQACDYESVLRFVLGEDIYWCFEMDPDETGTVQHNYVPRSALAYVTWNETKLERKRLAKGN